jgi:hypothetical protein
VQFALKRSWPLSMLIKERLHWQRAAQSAKSPVPEQERLEQ